VRGRSLLLANASILVTMDDARREIRDGAVLVVDQRIEAVGSSADLAGKGDETIDLSGYLVCPGLVNTHHHFYQTLTRAVPAAQDAELFDWLRTLYPIWARLTPEMARISALTAMAELMRPGRTTSSHHLSLYPNGVRLGDTCDAAGEIGMRFHETRGAMSLGESRGGLPPDSLVEAESAILADMERVIDAYHDPSRYAMRRVALAPCSPFSVTRDLMREAAVLARTRGVRLHTHLAENDNDIAFTREQFGCTPAEYCEELGWLGADVWHAHCVKLDAPGISRFGATGTGVAHCPSSNMRLASGVAPIRKMRDAGVKVGLGVDGSASNDGSHMLGEARQALLLQRAAGNPAAISAREVLEIATLGGASVLGRDDIGALAPGMAADLVGFRLDDLGFAGALHDPVAALIFCAPTHATFSMINGRVVIRDGTLTTIELPALVERHNRLAATLIDV